MTPSLLSWECSNPWTWRHWMYIFPRLYKWPNARYYFHWIELFLLSVLDSLTDPLLPRLLKKSAVSSCFTTSLLLLLLLLLPSLLCPSEDLMAEVLRPNLAVKSSRLSILAPTPLLERLHIKYVFSTKIEDQKPLNMFFNENRRSKTFLGDPGERCWGLTCWNWGESNMLKNQN